MLSAETCEVIVIGAGVLVAYGVGAAIGYRFGREDEKLLSARTAKMLAIDGMADGFYEGHKAGVRAERERMKEVLIQRQVIFVAPDIDKPALYWDEGGEKYEP